MKLFPAAFVFATVVAVTLCDDGETMPESELHIMPRAAPINVACNAPTVDMIVGQEYYFTSPNYPARYGNYEQCDRKFRVPANAEVVLDCPFFRVACYKHEDGTWRSGDFLKTVVDGQEDDKFCEEAGDSVNDVFPPASAPYDLEFDFASNYRGTKLGFECTVKATAKAAPTPPPETTCDCGRSQSGATPYDRIVGGQAARKNSYPWQVALVQGWYNNQVFCGGSILDEYTIVTAAHCTTTGNTYTIRAGAHDTSNVYESSVQIVKGKATNHPQYNSNTQQNDIAIIKLSSPLKLNDAVRPVCLPKASQSFAGQIATVTGWGTLRSGGSQPELLNEVDVKVQGTSICRNIYNRETISSDMLCAYTKDKDSCQGDSGGPLTIGDTLIGVVSWGYGCALEGYPGVYANVANLRSFIRSNSNLADACFP